MLSFALALALSAGHGVAPAPIGLANPLDGLQSFGPRVDKAEERAVSGHKSGKRFPLGGPAPGFVSHITWGEVLDKPVYVRVRGMLKRDGNYLPVDASLGPQPNQTRALDFLNQPGRFIRALRVCTTEREDDTLERLKGIEVKTATFKNGSFEAESGTEVRDLENCKTWHAWSTCPAGQAATEIGVYVQNSGPNIDAVRGLSVICAPPLSVTKP